MSGQQEMGRREVNIEISTLRMSSIMTTSSKVNDMKELTALEYNPTHMSRIKRVVKI